MDIRELKYELENEAERISKLAKSLSDKGEALDGESKHQIREVLSGTWLRMMLAEARFFFAEGQLNDLEKSFERVRQTLDQLS